jgi:hypothetical protein
MNIKDLQYDIHRLKDKNKNNNGIVILCEQMISFLNEYTSVKLRNIEKRLL